MFPMLPKNIMYNFLDIVAKNFYGLYIFYEVYKRRVQLPFNWASQSKHFDGCAKPAGLGGFLCKRSCSHEKHLDGPERYFNLSGNARSHEKHFSG